MTGLRAFELYLMAHMRGRAAIEAALASLELSPADVDEAEKRVAKAMDFFDMKQHPLDVYVDVLGAPLESTPDEVSSRSEAFAGSLRHRFHLPVWPELDFVLRTHREGWTFGPELVRRVGARPPVAKTARELQAWSIVESEVVAQYGAFATEDAWNSGKDASYLVEEGGARYEIVLTFDFALLQKIEIVADRE
jgi:hypothetical protein